MDNWLKLTGDEIDLIATALYAASTLDQDEMDPWIPLREKVLQAQPAVDAPYPPDLERLRNASYNDLRQYVIRHASITDETMDSLRARVQTAERYITNLQHRIGVLEGRVTAYEDNGGRGASR